MDWQHYNIYINMQHFYFTCTVYLFVIYNLFTFNIYTKRAVIWHSIRVPSNVKNKFKKRKKERKKTKKEKTIEHFIFSAHSAKCSKWKFFGGVSAKIICEHSQILPCWLLLLVVYCHYSCIVSMLTSLCLYTNLHGAEMQDTHTLPQPP